MREPQFPRKAQFLRIATAFEGGLVLIAYAIGWMTDIDPLAHFRIDSGAIAAAIPGTLLLYALFALSYSHPTAGLRDIKRFLVEKLGPLLASCRWYELLYLGLLAGGAEEILFRGVLQPWLERDWGWLGGLVFSNLMFALAHWVTPLYGVLAGLTGAYLGLSMDWGEERNLLIPMLIHALYDFLAFLAVAKTLERQ